MSNRGSGDAKFPYGVPSIRHRDDDEDDHEVTRMGRRSDIAPPPKSVSNRDRPSLIVLQGPTVGETYRIEGDEVTLGRGSNVTIRIQDDNMSRKHARLFKEGGELHIEDLGSANGTQVNGEAIGRRKLADGDKVTLGAAVVLKFTYHDELDEQFQQKMYDAALRDGLTRIFNKRYFQDRLVAEMAYSRRHGTPLSLILFDVDHFKKINDGRGHLAGDHVLTKLAQVAASTIRTEDVIARYGGEEFGIICRGITSDRAVVLAERLRVVIEGTDFSFETVPIPVTVSLGVASVPASTITKAEELTNAADSALYQSKHGGRNRVSIHKP
ncbi:MAG: GGDEF domain-containing protein [Polyangiaceae bacterium]